MIIKKAMPYGFVLTLLFSQLAWAESPARTSFNQAVALYQEGLISCREAHKLRASDLDQAKKSFQKYEAAKNKATDLSPQILTTTEFNIDRNIKLCEQAKADILRSEAIPVIETAIDLCKSSKSALLKSKTEQSRHLYDRYLSQKQKAFELATDVIKVQSIRLNIARCDKFENKLNKSEIALASLNQKISTEKSKASKSYQLCTKGAKSTASASKLSPGTTKAKQLLAQSKVQLASVGISTLKSINAFSNSKLGINLLKEMKRSEQCQTELSKSIQSKDVLLAKKEKIQRANQLAQKAKAEKTEQQKALYQKILYQKTQEQKLAQVEKEKKSRQKPIAKPARDNSANKNPNNNSTNNNSPNNRDKVKKEALPKSKPMTTEVAKKKSAPQRDWTNLVADIQTQKQNSFNSDLSDDENGEDDGEIDEPNSTNQKSGIIRDWTQLIK